MKEYYELKNSFYQSKWLKKTIVKFCDCFFDWFYQYEVIQGVERKKIEKLPEAVFREAIANALIHRVWDVESQIRVSMFDDRIEIVSPGGCSVIMMLLF